MPWKLKGVLYVAIRFVQYLGDPLVSCSLAGFSLATHVFDRVFCKMQRRWVHDGILVRFRTDDQ